jgi:M6 family metalloprotease-like protein
VPGVPVVPVGPVGPVVPVGGWAGAALVVLAALVAAPAARADYIDHFATRADVGLYKVPARGVTRVLVVPIIVDGLPFEQGDEPAFLDDVAAFYADPADDVFAAGFTFTGYWEQASLGRFRPVATVATPVRFPRCPPLGAYADCAIPRGAGLPEGDVQGALAVLDDALAFIDEILRCAAEGPGAGRTCTAGGGVDFPAFDTSGQQGVADGFVDGVILVSNAAFPGIALPVKDLATSALLSFIGPFPDFSYDGVVVPSVAIAGRAQRPGRQTWVSVHEFGHLLGFADLYDEKGATTDLPYTLMGGWYYDEPASLLDPFSRVAIGWANVIAVAGPGTFALPTSATSGTVLKVGDGDEFFLVEHRRRYPGVLDDDLTVDAGVLVQRVRLAKRPPPTPGSYFNTLSDCVNCTAFDGMLTVEEADGAYDLQRGRARADAADLFVAGGVLGPSDDTAPRTVERAVGSTNRFDGAPTGITIRVDALDVDAATITVEAPAVADPCAALGDLCVGDCVRADDGHGRCGDFAVFPPPAPVDEPAPAAGCACATASAGDAGLIGVSIVVLRRRRRRARGVADAAEDFAVVPPPRPGSPP